MPHVILRGVESLERLYQDFTPLRERTEGWLVKIEELYLERGGSRAILPAIVVEEGHSQTFYLRISVIAKVGRVTVRLDPATDPIKTRGVKRSVALLAEAVMNSVPGAAVESHNLTEYLKGSGSRVE